MRIDPALKQKITQLVEGLGYVFWGCEVISHHRGGTLFRVYIDGSPDRGVHSEDCALVSRQLGSLLDVEDAFHGRYTMEVSSPGLDRRLFTLDQFNEYVGKRVSIRLTVPLEGKRHFTGRIQRVDENVVYLETELAQAAIQFNDIEHAHVIAEVSF